jgi:hypothetical protein
MIQIANELNATIQKALPLLNEIKDEIAAQKPSADKWSKKEILGHLIDSAANNQQKFVRCMAQNHTDFVGYAQNHWVEAQAYQQYDWLELVQNWKSYNAHIEHIIKNTAVENLKNTISIDGVGPFELGFIMTDYVEHLKHHLAQILPETDWKSRFNNVYYR